MRQIILTLSSMEMALLTLTISKLLQKSMFLRNEKQSDKRTFCKP